MIYEQVIDKLDETLKANILITDPNNVYPGEAYDKELLTADHFPRLEYMDKGEDNWQYLSQGSIEPVLWFQISGWIRNPVTGHTVDRMKAIGKFSREVRAALFNWNNLKLLNTLGIKGFEKMHSLYHIVNQPEVMKRTDGFHFVVGIEYATKWDEY